MIFNILLVIHFVSDFYLQNDSKVERKSNQDLLTWKFYKTEMFKHTILYVFLSSVIFTLFSSDDIFDYIIVVGIFFSHGAIDIIKIQFSKRYEKCKIHLFLLDQVIHISILYFLSMYILSEFEPLEWIEVSNTLVLYALIILLLGKTANVVFGILFDNFKPDRNDTDDGHKNAGGLIGIMERLLIFILLVSGNIGSIGFIIAAKSVARFKKLSETQFGEYFLLGTLFSVLYTLLVYYLFLV